MNLKLTQNAPCCNDELALKKAIVNMKIDNLFDIKVMISFLKKEDRMSVVSSTSQACQIILIRLAIYCNLRLTKQS